MPQRLNYLIDSCAPRPRNSRPFSLNGLMEKDLITERCKNNFAQLYHQRPLPGNRHELNFILNFPSKKDLFTVRPWVAHPFEVRSPERTDQIRVTFYFRWFEQWKATNKQKSIQIVIFIHFGKVGQRNKRWVRSHLSLANHLFSERASGTRTWKKATNRHHANANTQSVP